MAFEKSTHVTSKLRGSARVLQMRTRRPGATAISATP